MPPNDDTPEPCTERATAVFEAYSRTSPGGPHGSLDAAVYCCAGHVEAYRTAILAAGLTPFRAGPPGVPRACGQVFAYDRMALTSWAEFVR